MPIIMHHGQSNIPPNELLGLFIALNLFYIFYVGFMSIYWLAQTPKYKWFESVIWTNTNNIVIDTFTAFVALVDAISLLIYVGIQISKYL